MLADATSVQMLQVLSMPSSPRQTTQQLNFGMRLLLPTAEPLPGQPQRCHHLPRPPLLLPASPTAAVSQYLQS